MLLVHGKKDRIFDVEQRRLMAKSLAKAEKEFEYVEFDTGTHYLSIQRHRHEFFRLLDRFLKHILVTDIREISE
ncbi:MAG: dipeptidyl aminopeptidase/acylaminoacyl peptidase [Candidatus Azotimanducaceae bacterium]